MRLLRVYRKEELASVYVFSMGPDARGRDRLVETVESVQPPIPRNRKWVIIVSTFAGCPVGCAMCDAGDPHGTRLTSDEILGQIAYVIEDRLAGAPPAQHKLKIQFARMGEPALNPAVLRVLETLPHQIRAPGLLPSVSTIAPAGCEPFFEALREIKDALYPGGRFQFQISVHTTDPASRRALVPVRCLSLPEMARLGERFHRRGDRKVTLNFAPSNQYAVDPAVIGATFDPNHFLVKITPLNPTARMLHTGLTSRVDGEDPLSAHALVEAFQAEGFEVLLSIGELEENRIGSNCGQFVTEAARAVREGYASESYRLTT